MVFPSSGTYEWPRSPVVTPTPITTINCPNPPCVSGVPREVAIELETPVDLKRLWAEREASQSNEPQSSITPTQEKLRGALGTLISGLRNKVNELRKRQPLTYDEQKFRELGCIALASPSLRAFHGVVALFPAAFLAEIAVCLTIAAAAFDPACRGHVTPLALNLHSSRHPAIPPSGTFNLVGQCNNLAVGGIYNYALPGVPSDVYATKPKDKSWKAMSVKSEGCGMPPPSKEPLESPVPRGCSPSLYRLRPFGCRPGHFTGKFGLPRDVSRLSTTADLRVLALDLHSESPCVVSEAFLPVVLSCSSTCAALACVPFHRLETVAPAEVLDELDALLVATNGAAAIIETNKQMQALVSIITELQTRLEFLECAPAKA